ncbi:terpene synthase family protein [Nonomuraea jabiensis]|uniref:terpene synthase family protein n=1 Tax=Nonomuraea jabiensis TaxID=882448 RepID=UPI003D76547C
MASQDKAEMFTLPSLSCPFPIIISPHVKTVQAGTQQWIERFGVFTPPQLHHFTRAAYGELAARVYPYARLPLLQLMSDWVAWLFAIDDVIYESDAPVTAVQTIPELRRVLTDDHQEGSSGFGRALADIRARIAAVANTEQLHRWTTATCEYLLAQLWELSNRTHGQVPTLEAYVTMRRLTGAMHTVYALIDIAAERPLAADLWSEPQVRAIRRHAVDVVVWDNDLISWRKERLAANGLNNLVSVLTAHAELSVPEAFDRIVRMREEAIAQVEALGRRLTRRRHEPLTALVNGLQTWISGSLAYSMGSSRYLPAGGERDQ